MRVELLMAGDELLAGAIVDTNAPWLMSRLYDEGLLAKRKTTVGDDVTVISDALVAAAERGTELIVCCGGLGPTDDDVTAESAARAAGLPRALHPEARRMVEERLSSRGLAVTDRQLRQARLPAGAAALENPKGTAPGFRMELHGGCTAFFLPGPPREFRPMVEAQLLPWLKARSAGDVYAALTIRTFGGGESTVADRVAGVTARLSGVKVAYQVLYPEIHLRLRAAAPSREMALEMCREAAAELEGELGDLVFGRDEDSLASVVGKALAGRKETLALAESCTGGLLGALLTDTPGSSRYLLGALVTYANEMKVELLGVPERVLAEHGAVSEECAVAMAEGALRRAGTTHALSVTGIAGPGGGTDAKPVGTVWLGLSSRDRDTLAVRRLFRGDREMIRRVSAFAALDLLRHRLAGRL